MGLIAVAGCGGPKIQIKGKVVYPEDTKPMIPATYLLGPGDELEVLYNTDPTFKVAEYVIDLEDTLRVDFFYYPVLSRTLRVRPDGYITLSRMGDVKAAGMKPRDLAKKIRDLYAPFSPNPW